MAAFGLLMLVRDADGEATHLSQWSGLARKSPGVAAVMTVLLLSMAGIPLTPGSPASSSCSGPPTTRPDRWW